MGEEGKNKGEKARYRWERKRKRVVEKAMERSLTSYLQPPDLLLLHPWVPPSYWQKYINWDMLALKSLPQQLLSQTLYWVIEQRIYMTNGVNRLGWFTSLSKHSVFTPGNQSINLFPAHVRINSLLQIPSGVRQQTHESYCIEYWNTSSPFCDLLQSQCFV